MANAVHHLYEFGPFVLDPAERLLAHMSKDKKVRDGRIALILPHHIGEAFVMKDAPIDPLCQFLAEAAAQR